jgi:hypothetical protein
VHNSGINSLLCLPEVGIFTGGDDGAVGLFVYDGTSDFPRSGIRGKIGAHSSHVTGIAALDKSRIVTCSVDQRVSVWCQSYKTFFLRRWAGLCIPGNYLKPSSAFSNEVIAYLSVALRCALPVAAKIGLMTSGRKSARLRCCGMDILPTSGHEWFGLAVCLSFDGLP